MTTHTPGPWRVGPTHKDDSFAIHAQTASVVHCKPFSSSHKSAEANARLIAAAPDLLAALISLVRASDGHHGSIRERDIARAAIAKAEGKSWET